MPIHTAVKRVSSVLSFPFYDMHVVGWHSVTFIQRLEVCIDLMFYIISEYRAEQSVKILQSVRVKRQTELP